MNRRASYTLFELVLAIAVGIVLLWTLYSSFSAQINLAKEGREQIDEANHLRSIALLIQGDIHANLGPINPSNSLVPVSNSTTTQNTSVLFNLGVLGDATSLILTISKVPRELTPAIEGKDDNPPQGKSDLRRVTYWLIGTGDDAKGLARQEISAVTDPDALNNLPTATDPQDYVGSISDPNSLIIASEVKNVTFQYYGSLDSSQSPTWQTSWNGLTLDANANVTTPKPLGPPAAIAVELTLKTSKASKSDPGRELVVRHVIAINAANRWGPYQASTTSP